MVLEKAEALSKLLGGVPLRGAPGVDVSGSGSGRV